MKLYELIEYQATLEKLLCESSGELTPEIEAFEREIDLGVTEGVDLTHSLMERLEHAGIFYKTRAEQYQKISRGLAASHERIKQRIKDLMVLADKKELHGNEFRLQIKNSKSELILDELQLPKEYFKEKITLIPDKERIRTELEMGIAIAGAILKPKVALTAYVQKKIAI